MMRKLLIIPLAILLPASCSTGSIAQEQSELKVKYVFWGPPDYTTDGKNYESVAGYFATNFKPDFLSKFDELEEEYQLVKRARTKLTISSWLLPSAALIFAFALIEDSGPAPYIIAASLAVGEILIDVSAYRDLSEAVDMRNTRLMPTVTIKF